MTPKTFQIDILSSSTWSCVIGYSVPDVSRKVGILSSRIEIVDISAVGCKINTLPRNVGKKIYSDATSCSRRTNTRSTPLQKPKRPHVVHHSVHHQGLLQLYVCCGFTTLHKAQQEELFFFCFWRISEQVLVCISTVLSNGNACVVFMLIDFLTRTVFSWNWSVKWEIWHYHKSFSGDSCLLRYGVVSVA